MLLIKTSTLSATFPFPRPFLPFVVPTFTAFPLLHTLLQYHFHLAPLLPLPLTNTQFCIYHLAIFGARH